MVRKLLTLALAALPLLAGCGEDTSAGTRGQLDNLTFSYDLKGTCEGCSLQREVLPGSVLDIAFRGLSSKVRYEVRSSAEDVVAFQSAARCSQQRTMDCVERITTIAKKVGDADLEIYDDWTGTVLDRVTVKVRDAATIDTTVKLRPGDGAPRDLRPDPKGELEVKVDSDVEIISVPRAANGEALLATSDAIRSAYANETVLGPREASVLEPTPAANAFFAKAHVPGSATVSFAGGSARRDLVFRVVD